MSTSSPPNPPQKTNQLPSHAPSQQVGGNALSRRQFWLVLIAMMLLAANMRSPIVALGSLAPVLQDVLGISTTQVGWLGSVPVLMFALGALVSPTLAKRLGFGTVLLISIVVMTLGIVLRVLWVGWWGFLIGTVMLSLAIGFANTLAAPAIKHLTPDRIPLVTGVLSITMSVMAGLSAGMVIPLEQWLGWQWALGGWAILGVLASVIWWSMRHILQDQSKHGQTQHQQTQYQQTKQQQTHQTKSTSQHQHNSTVKPDPSHKRSVWQMGIAWQIAIFMGLQSLLFYVMASFMPAMLMAEGMTAVKAGQMGMIYQLMAPIAMTVLMLTMHRIRWVRPLAIFSAIITVVGMAGMAYGSIQLAWLWSACMGMGGAMTFTMCIMLIGMRTHDSEQASNLSGMAQTVGYTVALVGPLLVGWLHERFGNWEMALHILVGLMAVNVVFGWFVSRPMMIDGTRL